MDVMKDRGTLLVVAAHPDDEILGCGATVARLIQEGCTAYVLILGEGVTSRDESRNRAARMTEIDNLRKESIKANEFIGAEEIFFQDFPDNRFDAVPMLDIVKSVEQYKQKTRPDVIFTHFRQDLNIDHQITYRAVLTATRPLPGESVKALYTFETSSSTEWNFPLSFAPNVYVNIENTLEAKLKAVSAYSSESREYPHPRSVKAIRNHAGRWGSTVGCKAAEAFELVRLLL